LAEGIKSSIYPDRLLEAFIIGDNYVLPENVRLSVKMIIEFLHEIKSTQKDLVHSPICLQLSDLAVNLGTSFHMTILEVETKMIYFNIW